MTKKLRHALVDLTEAAYAPAESDAAWVRNLVEASGSLIDAGHGVLGFVVDARRRKIRHTAGAEQLAAVVRPMHEIAPEVAFAAYRLPRAFAVRDVMGRDFTEHNTRRFLGPVGPIWAVHGVDASGSGVVLTAPQGRRGHLPLGQQAWKMAAAHLAAGYRLRKGTSHPEAILSPRGAVLHCEAEAEAKRASLVEAAKRQLEAQRTTTLEPWRVLTDGTWSIVDTVDTDGKRLLIARRNPLPGRSVTPLDEQERQVCAMTAAGQSQKAIAYELGLHPSTVARRIRTALVKLRLRSAADLARHFAWV